MIPRSTCEGGFRLVQTVHPREPMKLDLSEISQRPGMRVVVDVDQPCVEEAHFGCAEPVRGQLAFANGGELLLIDGKVRTAVELPCDRCLEPARLPTAVIVEERFPLLEVALGRRPAWPPMARTVL